MSLTDFISDRPPNFIDETDEMLVDAVHAVYQPEVLASSVPLKAPVYQGGVTINEFDVNKSHLVQGEVVHTRIGRLGVSMFIFIDKIMLPTSVEAFERLVNDAEFDGILTAKRGLSRLLALRYAETGMWQRVKGPRCNSAIIDHRFKLRANKHNG